MPKNSGGERRQRLWGGCREKVRQRWAEARCWGTSVPQNKPIASLHLEGASGSRRMAIPHSDWLPPLSSAGNPPLLHRPASQTQTLLQQTMRVLWCPFSPEVFPGRQVAALLLTSPLLLPTLPTYRISPADSINQLDAGARKKPSNYGNRPGALELTLTEGPGRPPSRQWGGEGGRTVWANAANLGWAREPTGEL